MQPLSTLAMTLLSTQHMIDSLTPEKRKSHVWLKCRIIIYKWKPFWISDWLNQFTNLIVIVWEGVPGAKSCGQPIWLKIGTEVRCDEIFQKPLWLTSLTFSFGVTEGGGGGVSHFLPFSTKNPAFQEAFWKCVKTPLVNCTAKRIWPWTLL